MTPKCQSFWGHRFEPRYSYGGSRGDLSAKGAYSVEDFERQVRAMQAQTYHGDVCVRCGAIVNKPESAP